MYIQEVTPVPKDQVLNTRISASDLDVLKRAAALAGVSTSAFVTEAALREAATSPSLEVRRRAEGVIREMNLGVTPRTLQALRAAEVLEWIGTRSARQVVEELSRGRADALLTREARATLARMPKE